MYRRLQPLHRKLRTKTVWYLTQRCQLSLIALLLGGCAAQQHSPGVWLGSTFEELHRAFGDPAGVLINSNNNRVYAFRDDPDQSQDQTTQLTYGEGQITVKNSDCVLLFELEGKVVSNWDRQGEGCGTRPIPLPYQVRNEGLDRRGS